MSKPWDDTMKRLFAINPQDMLDWLMPGARSLEQVPLELKATTRTRNADVLYKVIIKRKIAIIHIEFQKRSDPNMAKRVWEYNVLATLTYNCPVYSFVIYLRPMGAIPASPLEWGLSQFQRVHIFHFQNILLSEMHVEDLRRFGLKGLLPLCLLTREGSQHEVAEAVFTELREQKELLSLALTLASMVYERQEDQQWLERWIMMLEDILVETWFYQRILQKGVQEGLQKGREEGLQEGQHEGMLKAARQIALNVVANRFPELEEAARRHISNTQNLDVLQQMIIQLMEVKTEGEAALLLLKLENGG